MSNFQKGFALLPIIVVILIFFILGIILLKPFSNPPSTFIKDTFQKVKNEEPQKNLGDLIDGYPHECEKRMGFDNYRTFQSLAIDPQDSKTMYIAIEYKGVFKSQDGGKTWSKKSKGLRGYPDKNNPKVPCAEQHPLLVIDPTNPQRILLTSASSPGTLKDRNSESGGVYESLDGGETWDQLFNETMNAWTYEALTLDPRNTKIAYVGTTSMPASYNEADPNKLFVTKGIVYKTDDGGKNWEELPTGFVPNLRSGKLFINPKNTDQIIFTTIALPPNQGGGQIQSEQVGILQTTDGGKSWQQLESLPKNQRAISRVDIAPQNYSNIFILINPSTNEEYRYYSNDGGKTFNQTDAAVNLFKFDPHDPKGLRLLGLNLYAAPRSIFESLDGGKTWNTYSNLPAEVNNDSRVSNIVWDPSDKNVVYLNGDEGRIWKSEDNGKTWRLILSLEMLK